MRPPLRGRALLGAAVAIAIAFTLASSAPPVARSASLERPTTPPITMTDRAVAPASDDDREPETLEEQRRLLFAKMQRDLGITSDAMAQVRSIFAASPVLSQGNPAIVHRAMLRSECRRVRREAKLEPAHVAACGAPNMVPLFDAEAGETPADAPVCIDQFEFPDLPCEYPVVHVRAREAALLCQAIGKRLCDAHEWEGACAGSLRPADKEYVWGWPRKDASRTHNILREKVWAYGPRKNHALCATASFVSPECDGGGWATCGSNTYPTGAFPSCQSSFGVFDLHGNVAEHMSLPRFPEELASHGGDGFTEMKGSWFAFLTADVYDDDCRYRAPAWHETRVMSEKSHMNYHLGFRCCKDVERR